MSQEGLGSKAGVSLMFARMKKLTWGMTTWKTGELAFLLLTRTQAWAALSGGTPGLTRQRSSLSCSQHLDAGTWDGVSCCNG